MWSLHILDKPSETSENRPLSCLYPFSNANTIHIVYGRDFHSVHAGSLSKQTLPFWDSLQYDKLVSICTTDSDTTAP